MNNVFVKMFLQFQDSLHILKEKHLGVYQLIIVRYSSVDLFPVQKMTLNEESLWRSDKLDKSPVVLKNVVMLQMFFPMSSQHVRRRQITYRIFHQCNYNCIWDNPYSLQKQIDWTWLFAFRECPLAFQNAVRNAVRNAVEWAIVREYNNKLPWIVPDTITSKGTGELLGNTTHLYRDAQITVCSWI